MSNLQSPILNPQSSTSNAQSVIVRKLNPAGELVVSYAGIVLERGPAHVRLEAPFSRDTLELGYTTFEKGDRFVEWYFADRWYNIFEVHSVKDDRIKGWYCNVTRPAHIEDNSVSAVDLALDVWIGMDGSILVLDEDEFTGLNLADADRDSALKALAELKELVRERRPPFDRLGSQATNRQRISG
ncbi:MAG TPA: DUF402 domain-containing protein [Anaerolineae bacterium]|nr:DUF402 domain-containing protein [Anaerolineae bacterium]